MKIYQINLDDDDRLGRYFDLLPDAPEAERYFLIIHPVDVDGSVLTDMPDLLKDPNCSQILYVKGVPHAGLSRTEAKRIERENDQRVHFLSYSVGDSSDLVGDLSKRFSRFFEEVESENKTDWLLIDEPWPKNLLSIYFIAKALSTLDEDDAKAILAEQNRWVIVWQAAKKEYRLRTLDDLPYEGLNVGNALEVMKKSISCFGGEEASAEELHSLILYGISNDTIYMVKDMRHNWLGNQVLSFDADYISKIYIEDSPGRNRFDERLKPGGDFEQYLKKAITLSSIIIDGFSPASLVDSSPLGVLSKEARAIIKKALHDAYVKQTEIKQLPKSIQAASVKLSDRLNYFIKEWHSDSPVEQARIKKSFEDAQHSARVLYELLGKLPKGVVLP